MTGTRLDLGAVTQTMQLALLTAAPPADPTIDQLNEVAATGYARQNVTWGLATNPIAGQPSQIANAANLLYGPFVDVNGLTYPATHCALIGTGVPDSSANLLSANTSDVETDASGWSAFLNTTISRSTAQAKTGTASLASTVTASGDSQVYASGFVAAKPFVTYTASAWVFSAVAGVQARVDLWFTDSNGTSVLYSSAPAITLAANTWTQVSRTVQAPAGSAQMKPVLRGQATAAGQVFYYDSMSLAAVSTQDVLMTWAFDTPGQASQNESLQISAGALTMSLG
jgi:hypothetical protein